MLLWWSKFAKKHKSPLIVLVSKGDTEEKHRNEITTVIQFSISKQFVLYLSPVSSTDSLFD